MNASRGSELRLVHAVAERLVDDLREAKSASGGWAAATKDEQPVHQALDVCLERLGETGVWGRENQLLSSELWRVAGEILEVGALQRHARLKPRGYAGDFEMLDKICHRWECDHPLGSIFDRYFQNQAAPQAVRNRTRIVTRAITRLTRQRRSRQVKIVSVGSGPAVDVRDALRLLPEQDRRRMSVTLIDIDPHALEFCLSRLSKLIPRRQIVAARENLVRLPRRSEARQLLADADLIICSGFFDYLESPAAIELLSTFWNQLRLAGELLIFNFSRHNPSRAYMEWIGNWYLVYRDTDELLRLAAHADIPAALTTVGGDETGVSLLLTASKDVKQEG